MLPARQVLTAPLLLGVLAAPLASQAVSKIQRLTVSGHHFTTEVSSRSRRASVNDPEKTRYVVLQLRGRATDEGRVFTDDFVMRYRLDGVEKRKRCSGIARANASRAGNLGDFVLSTGAWISVKTGASNFAVACTVDAGINAIQLYRLGVASPLFYEVGTDRPYSVLVSTNQGTSVATRVAGALDVGGYAVTVSNKLAATTAKVTVHYAGKAEQEGREVSQRVMTVLDRVPTFKKMTLRTKYDIVVWIGK